MPVTKELLLLNKPGHAAHKYMIMRADTKQLVYAQPPTGWLPCPMLGAWSAVYLSANNMSNGSVWDGVVWTVDGRLAAVDDAVYTCIHGGWSEYSDYVYGLARYSYGYLMSPYNDDYSPQGRTRHSCTYGIGAVQFAWPSYMGTYTQCAVSLYGASCLRGTLAPGGAPATVARLDGSSFNLRVIASATGLTAQQVVAGTGGVATAQFSPAQLNGGAEAVGGTGKGWCQYWAEIPASYYYQTAPGYSTLGWASRLALPSSIIPVLEAGSVYLHFSFNPVYPSQEQAQAIVFNNLIHARLEVLST